MDSGYIDFVIDGLEPGELAVMLELSSLPKSRSRFFTEPQLQRRKYLRAYDVHVELRCLQDKGLATQVDPGKRLWTLTRYGKMVEHALEARWFRDSIKLERFLLIL